jgi:hypothetical protein
MQLKPKRVCQCEGKELPLLILPTFNQRQRRSLAHNTGGGGGQNRPWLLGVEPRNQFKKDGEDWFEPTLNIHNSFPPFSSIFYLPLCNYVAKENRR